MANCVKCVDCKFSTWTRTDSGRIKKKVAGRCEAVIDVRIPVLMCSPPPTNVFFKQGIWPDNDGECDFFQPNIMVESD
ncbi:hypothetical protein [Pseudomonas serbica]|uniref:hypothetical protein n=1 Tax=Pseudomonas serbica TaxID=2965074 RepID=UPI00237B8610|nr:hypothetical protein [Pseudomonas serbica]